MEAAVERNNIQCGYERVVKNQGASGVDGRPLVERWGLAHARSDSPVLVRPHGLTLTIGYSAAFLVGFMNRPLRNARRVVWDGSAKNHTVVYETVGDSITITVDGDVQTANLSTMSGPGSSTEVIIL